MEEVEAAESPFIYTQETMNKRMPSTKEAARRQMLSYVLTSDKETKRDMKADSCGTTFANQDPNA